MLLKMLSITTASLALVGGFFKFPSEAKAQNFAQIYVFGDSLSDGGNVFKATQKKSPPSPPYFRGRYSNGPVWVEYFAQKLGLSSNPNTNFAYGGATTSSSKQMPLGLLAQIEHFTASNTSADPNALYIIWAGTNDYLGGATNPTVPIKNLTMAVKSLSAVGAKNILVINLPDLGKLPETRNSRRADLLNNLTEQHNSSLTISLNSLRQQLNSQINITYYDVNSLFNQILNNPKKFGFTDVTTPCLSQVSLCGQPNEYLFWDSIHPTTAAHKLLAELVFLELKSASKPSSVVAPEITVIAGVIVLGGLGAYLVMKRTSKF